MEQRFPDFDPSRPNDARILDYLIGGKDNFAADREAADRAIEVAPELVDPGIVHVPAWHPELGDQGELYPAVDPASIWTVGGGRPQGLDLPPDALDPIPGPAARGV